MSEKKSATTEAAAPKFTYDPRLHQPIHNAALFENPDPEIIQRPPDKLKNDKNSGKIFEQIVGKEYKNGLWDEIKFQTPAGKRLNYTATIKTDYGTIVMQLWPEVLR